MLLKDLPNHHAVLLIRKERQALSSLLWDELLKLSLAHSHFEQTVLDIDTVREIISWANSPYHEVRTALISFHTATLPAQNAMLKVLEEPQGVRFIIVTSNKEHLLDTLLSRVVAIGEENAEIPDSVFTFLRAKPSARMKLKEMAELTSREDEMGRKDREAIRLFILQIVSALSLEKQVPHSYIIESLRMASYAGDPSTSGKTILEYLSLLLPTYDTM